jgi:septal ring factor EnvC (AmiA/AmiB activator)
MLSPPFRLVLRLMQKAGVAALLVAVGLGAYAFWFAARDPVDYDQRRSESLRLLTGEQQHLRAALDDVKQRIASLETALAAQQERLHTSDRAIAALRAGDIWWRTAWDRLFGNADQVRTKEECLARFEKMKADATARAAELRPNIIRASWERDGMEIDLERVNRHLAAVERNRSKTLHYLSLAWQRSRWYVIAALALWFLAPTLWRRRRQPG